MINSICITFDTDWAPEEAVADAIELINTYKINVTIFATNFYSCLQNLPANIEVGLHPNFNNILKGNGQSFEKVFDELYAIYPKAKGLRSHSLTQSSYILMHAKEKGIVYDSNTYNPNQAKAFVDYNGLLRFTHCWVDLGHILDKKEFVIKEIPLKTESHNIVDFHPIHTFINTDTLSFYNNVKHLTTNATELNKSKNNTNHGIRTLFINLLDDIKQNHIQTKTMYQLYKENL